MICYGAKHGCVLKGFTGVIATIQAYLLALYYIEILGNEVIIDDHIENTIKNIDIIGNKEMKDSDKVTLDIMMYK